LSSFLETTIQFSFDVFYEGFPFKNMTATKHVIISGITGIAFGYFMQSWLAFVSSFLGGILIDVDHIIDFYIRKKRISLSIKELENFCMKEKEGKMYLIFHSYELILALWLTAYFFPHVIWIGLLFGMSVHLILDQIFNNVYPWAYFGCYRAKHGFVQKVFFNEDFYEELRAHHHEKSS